MRKISSFLFLLILFVAVTNCDTTNTPKDDAETVAAKAKLIEADSEFRFELFKTVLANDSSTNVFISPLSASMALGMTMNGATGNTLFEMQNTLGFADMTQQEINKGYKSLQRQLENADDEVDFHIANSVWSKQGFKVKEVFTQTVEEYFDAETASLDFNDPKTLDIINNWVSDKTNDRITKIINRISGDDVMFLINAVYFNGSWKYEFDPEMTSESSFYRDDNQVVATQMMSQGSDLKYLIDDEATLIELPYGNEAFSMLFIKPSDRNGSINALINSTFNAEQLKEWDEKLETGPINVFIPKLELEYKRKLIPDLQSLGMEQLFIEGAAELDNLFVDINNIFVSNVLQKTFLKMDEEGTEAAAVTAVTVTLESAGSGSISIIFDQPYAMLLREKATGTILFIGKIGDPTETSGN